MDPTAFITTRTCNKLRDVYMCTSQVSLMDMDRGILARIDRKLRAGLCDDEALRTLRVPATAAKWATWKRYCDAAGVSMGRAVPMLIDPELISVLGEHTDDEPPVFAQRATEQLAIREAKIAAREQRAEFVSKPATRRRGGRSSPPSLLRPTRDDLAAQNSRSGRLLAFWRGSGLRWL